LYLQDQKFFYSIGIYRPCIYRKIPVNTGKMCFIAFNLKTTGPCKFFLYLQDPVITEPCIFVALGSGGEWYSDTSPFSILGFISFSISPSLPLRLDMYEKGTVRKGTEGNKRFFLASLPPFRSVPFRFFGIK